MKEGLWDKKFVGDEAILTSQMAAEHTVCAEIGEDSAQEINTMGW